MNDDIRAKIEAVFGNADPKKLEKLIALKNSELAKSLTEEQKKALLTAFMRTDAKAIRDKLKDLNLSKLNGFDEKALKEKLR